VSGMSWFRRSRPDSGPRPDHQVDAEVRGLLDPYAERAMVSDGDRAVVVASKVLENMRLRMERIDTDPDTSWAPEEVMSPEETTVLFVQLPFGNLVVTETAWYARQILQRWPADMVEHPIPPEARLERFFDAMGMVDHQDRGRRILNRALASHDHVDHHPELDDITGQDAAGVWLAVLLWFGIKSGLLNHQARSDT
jgi:hypothetical protein